MGWYKPTAWRFLFMREFYEASEPYGHIQDNERFTTWYRNARSI